MAKGKYAKKRLLKELRTKSIEDCGLSHRVVGVLRKSKIETAADLYLLGDEEIHGISGIGKKAMEEIQNIRTKF